MKKLLLALLLTVTPAQAETWIPKWSNADLYLDKRTTHCDNIRCTNDAYFWIRWHERDPIRYSYYRLECSYGYYTVWDDNNETIINRSKITPTSGIAWTLYNEYCLVR